MADYIYLLQNRLNPAQVRALDAVREAARSRSMPVFLVGGAVRDLSSGSPVRDLDFALQGDLSALLDDLKAGGAVIAGENSTLSSVYLIFPGGVRAEIGPTSTVTYPKPGQPEAQSATILDDLRRRDFAANAMAISLNEGSYGLLLDPLNGMADVESRELRLVSNYGFIEQPALLLRVARLSERLGWALEERTQGRYGTAKEENYISALPERDRGYEVEEIFHEDDPLTALEHLREEGWGDTLYPAWTPAKADRDALERVRDLMGQMERLGIHVDPSPVFFPLLTAKLAPNEVAELKGMFPRPGFVQQIDTLDTRARELGSQITGKAAGAPSDIWKMLFAAEPEVVLWLAYSSRSGAVQAKIKAFLNEWPQMRQRIPYALMQEMRITPELPGYDKLLEDLFFALIDGKLATPEAARAFLEPFSPPAPVVQASPRRRPAKSARSRGRKAVQEPVEPEPDEEDDVRGVSQTDDDEDEVHPALATDDDDDEDDDDADTVEELGQEALPRPEAIADGVSDESPDSLRSVENEPDEEPAPKPPVAAKVAAAPKSRAAKAVPAKAPALAKAPMKVVVVAKPAAKAPASPAKAVKTAAKAPAPAKKAAPAKKTVTVPAKAKSVPAKSHPVPAKKVAAKTAHAPAKVVAKKVAASAAKSAPTKHASKAAVPAKKGAKAATRGRR